MHFFSQSEEKAIVKDEKFWKLKVEQITSQQKIDLSRLNIDDRELQKWVIPALKLNQAVTHLNFSYNKLGDKGAADWGVRLLAEFLKENKTIISVNLSYNWIGREGAFQLENALRTNRTIIELRYDDDRCTPEKKEISSELLEAVMDGDERLQEEESMQYDDSIPESIHQAIAAALERNRAAYQKVQAEQAVLQCHSLVRSVFH